MVRALFVYSKADREGKVREASGSLGMDSIGPPTHRTPLLLSCSSGLGTARKAVS